MRGAIDQREVAGWRKGKGCFATEGQSLVWGKWRGSCSWSLRMEILRRSGLCLKGEKTGRYSSS